MIYKNAIYIPHDIAGTVHAGNPVSNEENNLMNELGIVWVRNDFYWNNIENEKGIWDWSRYDKMVEENIKSGRKILAILSFDTKWLYKDKKLHYYVSPQNLHLYLNYVEQAVKRYKGKVDAWEIWNEPNLKLAFWNGPTKDYYMLAKSAAAKIKSVDNAAKVIGGAFWGYAFYSPNTFIKNMWNYGAMENVDALSFHPYGVTPESTVKLYENFEIFIRGLGFKGEIWISEIGYPVAGIYPSRVTEDNLEDYIIKTITMLAAKGARTIFWYQLTESWTKNNPPGLFDSLFNSEKYFGLAYRDFEKRKGIDSFGKIINQIAGSEFLDYSYENKIHEFRFVNKNNKIVSVCWKNNKKSKIIIEE